MTSDARIATVSKEIKYSHTMKRTAEIFLIVCSQKSTLYAITSREVLFPEISPMLFTCSPVLVLPSMLDQLQSPFPQALFL